MSKKSLLSLLASRRNFKIPLESHMLHDKNWSFRTDTCFIRNTKNHPELHNRITQIMSSTFYREAPVPLALNLADVNCTRTRNFLNNEISAALNSGASLFYTKPNGTDFISIALNLIWERNKEYEVVGANIKEWHNAAAKVIATSPELRDKHLLWRNYQFQHIYDVGQKLLEKAPEKKYALYLSTGYIHPDFRSSGTSTTSDISKLDDYHNHWKNISDCIIYYTTTFSAMNKRIEKFYPHYKPFDYISYTDQELVLDGRRCFQEYEHLGGITYHVDFLKDFDYKS